MGHSRIGTAAFLLDMCAPPGAQIWRRFIPAAELRGILGVPPVNNVAGLFVTSKIVEWVLNIPLMRSFSIRGLVKWPTYLVFSLQMVVSKMLHIYVANT